MFSLQIMLNEEKSYLREALAVVAQPDVPPHTIQAGSPWNFFSSNILFVFVSFDVSFCLMFRRCDGGSFLV